MPYPPEDIWNPFVPKVEIAQDQLDDLKIEHSKCIDLLYEVLDFLNRIEDSHASILLYDKIRKFVEPS